MAKEIITQDNKELCSGPQDEKKLCSGDLVQLRNLSSRTELNGCRGTLLDFTNSTDRWRVEMVGGERVSVRPANILVPSMEEHVRSFTDACERNAGMLVTLHGLTNADLIGKVAEIVPAALAPRAPPPGRFVARLIGERKILSIKHSNATLGAPSGTRVAVTLCACRKPKSHRPACKLITWHGDVIGTEGLRGVRIHLDKACTHPELFSSPADYPAFKGLMCGSYELIVPFDNNFEILFGVATYDALQSWLQRSEDARNTAIDLRSGHGSHVEAMEATRALSEAIDQVQDAKAVARVSSRIRMFLNLGESQTEGTWPTRD